MVKSGKIIFLTPFAIVLAAIMIAPLVSADDGNVTPVTTPFITIDPIGNHAVGEVFVIKGTTNLPPVVDTLHILINPTTFNPAGVGSSFQSTVPILRGEKDSNFWSCTVPTTTGWLNFREPGMNPTQDARPDHYFVTVELSTDGNISQFQLFNILTADPDTNSTISPTPTPFITIDPIGNHTGGDVFFINGTTNLGRWENTLDLDIEWWAFNPAGRWSPMYSTNASIQPVGNGTGIWSAEILPAQWEMYTDVEHQTTVFRDVDPGEYVAYAESTSPPGPTVISQQTFFVVPPETPRNADGYNSTQKTGYITVTGASTPPTPARPADGSDPFMTLLLLVPVFIVLAAAGFFIRR